MPYLSCLVSSFYFKSNIIFNVDISIERNITRCKCHGKSIFPITPLSLITSTVHTQLQRHSIGLIVRKRSNC